MRWAFYLSLFAIPFSYLYVPGTGGRIGVDRIVQLLMLCGVFSQPRVCLRFFPTALFWFLGYACLRIVWGLWLTPEMAAGWWPGSREFIELLIPWLWLMFNVLQFPETRRCGLWALGLGCSLCAMFHVAGIGVTEVANGLDNRSTVFGVNANELGATYAAAMIALLGLWMLPPRTWSQRHLTFPLIALIGVAMAKTGSRTAILILAIGVLVLLFWGRTLGSKAKRVAALLALGAVLAVVLWQIPTVMERFDEINPQNVGQHNPRARMAPVLWEMFLRSPLYGLGPDSYQWELTRKAMPYLINENKLIASHNLALLLLVETGVVGFLIFSIGLGTALVAAWRARLKPCGPMPLALLLPFVVASATVANPIQHPVLWVAMGYALAGAA
ncbi:MAG: O-antigen ligase family protein [Verrucomicrobiota bacterium]|nr:O-antigen ligase family protein [Verrucomicrobiota bacterium]